MTQLLTTVEVAQHLRTPESTLRYWRHRGEGPPSFSVGRRVLYRLRDVEDWLDAQLVRGLGAQRTDERGAA